MKKVSLACSQCGSRNYSVPKNANAAAQRLEIKKFCKSCNTHLVHRETK